MEELKQLREIYHEKQHKIMIDSSPNKLEVSRETSDHLFKIQEYSIQQMRKYLKEKSNMFSSENIQNKVIILRNPKLRFLHLIKVLKTGRIIYRVHGRTQ